jgi:predicted nuclease with RNAse H fold
VNVVRWAGVDVGGSRKGFHLVVLDEQGICAGPQRCTAVDEALAWLLRSRPSVTAVDSPAAPAPDGERSRPCEREFLAARVCQLRPTPDRETIEARQDAYYEWIERGFALYDALRQAELTVIECFPTASWTRWAGPRNGRSRAHWTREALARMPLVGLRARLNQDDRDAIAAALTARAHTLGLTEEFGPLIVPAPCA